MKEIVKALTKVIVQGILEWKFPLFVGGLLTLNAIVIFLNEALRDYNDFSAVPELTWLKLFLGCISAGVGALIPFINSTVARTREQIKERKQQESDSK